MSYLKYNLPGLWFQIYREVLSLNENLNKDKLDKGQLREVTTAIFIGSTQRGIVRPYSYTKFQVALLELTKDLHRDGPQKEVYNTVKEIIANKRKEKPNGRLHAG